MAIVIPYVKQTWTDGSGGGTPISAARLGVLEEGILDSSLAPCVRAFHSANQSITTATDTTLAFDSERFDQAGGVASNMHDTVTNNSRLTCRYAGVYQITGNVQWASNASGSRDLYIWLNAATQIGKSWVLPAATTQWHHVTTLYALAVNDFVELRCKQNSGGALNVEVAGNFSPEFMMVRVG